VTVARSSGVFLGTDETTGVTIATTATTTSSQIDMLADDTSEGWMHLYLKFTSTVAVGSIDVKLIYSRVTGQNYADDAVVVGSVVPISGTKKVYLGQFPVGRYMQASVTNNATGANATNVTLGYELTKES
jgi:hypothetical protein